MFDECYVMYDEMVLTIHENPHFGYKYLHDLAPSELENYEDIRIFDFSQALFSVCEKSECALSFYHDGYMNNAAAAIIAENGYWDNGEPILNLTVEIFEPLTYGELQFLEAAVDSTETCIEIFGNYSEVYVEGALWNEHKFALED